MALSSAFSAAALLLLAPSAYAGVPCEERDLLDGAEVRTEGWSYPERAADGRLGPIGGEAHSSVSAWTDTESASLEYVFPLTRLGAILVEHEADDQVEVEVRDPSGSWRSLGVLGPKAGDGLEVSAGRFDEEVDGLRLVARGGLPVHIAEVAARRCGTPWPPDLALVEPRPDLERSASLRHLGGGRAAVGVLGAAALFAGAAGSWGLAAGAMALCLGVAALLCTTLGLAFLVAAAGALVVRALRGPGLALCVLAASASAWTQFGAFRLHGGAVHTHELFHYYLGSRYAEELGYTQLYPCVIAAAQLPGAEKSALTWRDLSTGELRNGLPGDVEAACPTRLGPAWTDFQQEVSVFWRTLTAGSRAAALKDHGYNPTPFWTLLGQTVGAGPPVSEVADLNRVLWVDPALLLISFGLIGVCFGWEAAAWVALLFSLGWPWRYGFVGGAFGRFFSFFLVCAALCFARRTRPGWAGVALGLATALRIFPAIFLLAPMVAALKDRRPARAWLLGGTLLGIVLAVAASAAALGAEAWLSFANRLLVHRSADSINTFALARFGAGGLADLGVGALVLLWLGTRGPGRLDLELGRGLVATLILAGLSSYYWSLLALIGAIIPRERAVGLVLLLIGVETIAQAGLLAPDVQNGLAYVLCSAGALWALSGPDGDIPRKATASAPSGPALG